ncbi:unnamed protein product, partial [Cyprideis torosa]
DFSKKEISVQSLATALGDGENVFFSPISISTCFGMLYAGAEGTTSEEMSNVFRYPKSQTEFRDRMTAIHQSLVKAQGNVSLNMANRIYLDNQFPVKKDFPKILETTFDAGAELVDFQKDPNGSRVKVNDWVAKQTEQKIQDLIPEGMSTGDTNRAPTFFVIYVLFCYCTFYILRFTGAVNSMTAMILANAIYFKGMWKSPFDATHTKPADFHLNSSDKVQVDMMYKEDHYYMKRDDELDATIIQLPYEGEEVMFTVLLPNEIEGLGSVIEKLTPEKLAGESGIFKDLRRSKIRLFMPRFKLTTSASLKEHLFKMGVKKAFDPASSEDLKTIYEGGPPIFVSDAFHKAFIEVNEEGTEAAAATGLMVMLMMLPPEVRMDRPFIYMISTTDEPATILFMGKFAKPSDK